MLVGGDERRLQRGNVLAQVGDPVVGGRSGAVVGIGDVVERTDAVAQHVTKVNVIATNRDGHHPGVGEVSRPLVLMKLVSIGGVAEGCGVVPDVRGQRSAAGRKPEAHRWQLGGWEPAVEGNWIGGGRTMAVVIVGPWHPRSRQPLASRRSGVALSGRIRVAECDIGRTGANEGGHLGRGLAWRRWIPTWNNREREGVLDLSRARVSWKVG